jgi:DNA-binding NarL/FixJ family response regulator
MKKTRVIYVEDDPTLLGIVTKLLRNQPELDVVSVGSSAEALAKIDSQVFQAALLDISLGQNSMSGIELAHQIRTKNPEIGIVFFSQYARSAKPVEQNDYYMGWSTIAKTADLDGNYISKVLTDSAIGKSHNVEAEETTGPQAREYVKKLNPRQIKVMSLLSQGYDTGKTAEALGLAQITVRAELTRIYKILVPEPEPGTDLRTTAVLRYLRSNPDPGWQGDD